uniref:Semaphorin 6C n=1 Tax=Paramormyrops kingsleyae TaxID=1676925 RepID=A0A3B3R3W9_9TELE
HVKGETLLVMNSPTYAPEVLDLILQMSTLEQDGEEVVGQARCPFESRQSNVGLFAGGDFYSATMTDFLASDAVIYRSLGEGSPVLRTVKYDSKWLREPHFLHAIEYGNYVYFFLSEIAIEYTTLGKVVFSRVARVCKNDNGGSPRVLERYWTSFLKARLNCSVPGDSFFYFDVLQSLTNVLQINQRPAVVGVFTTQANSITGSAVCAFYMDDIERVFNGRFKEQKSSESAWTPVPEDQVPKPRPGCCAGDGPAAAYKSSITFPDEMLTFIKSYPLMDEAVPSVNDRPCFTLTGSRYKLTQVAVDPSAGPYRNYTVLFLGSEDGRVLKVLASVHPNATFGSQLLEDIDVYNPSKCNVQGEDRRVLGLELDKEHHALFVAFSSCVIRVPLSRCSDYGSCKMSCLASRDPYCIWLKTGSCATSAPGFSYESVACLFADVLATTRKQNTAIDSAYAPTSCSPRFFITSLLPVKVIHTIFEILIAFFFPVVTVGVRRFPEADKSSNSVHYTLLIACVLVAFILGAILSGFLVSCYCSYNVHKTKRLGKDPEASISHALSLRSLAKLNGLLDSQGKDEKLDVPSPKLYNSFLPNGKEHHSSGNCRSGVGMDLTPHHHSEELSGLPTPDSTPELPIKSMKAFRNQWEKNQNCNNAKDSRPPSLGCSRSSSSIAQQAFPFSHGLAEGQALGGALHLEDRKIPNAERLMPQPYPCYPQTVVDVTTLDELLRHIHESSAAGGKNLALLTSALLPSGGPMAYSGRAQAQIPDTESSSYYSSSTLPRDSLTRRLDVPPDMPPSQSTLERTSRHPTQRHGLLAPSKMATNGSIVSRQHSFNHRSGHQPPPLLARMNSVGSASEVHHPLMGTGSSHLARQHNYSEGPQGSRGALIRRSSSLKPDLPPKPHFLPATSPVNPRDKFNY